MHEHFLAPLSHTVDDLTIRPWAPGDGPTLAAVATASHEHLTPWLDWSVPDDTPEAAEVRVRLFRGKYLAREDFVLSVWQDDELVGGTGFHPRWGGTESGVAEIGMWIAVDHAGRGLGTRLLRILGDWGLSEAWCWDRLVWVCDGRNTASARVAQKAGFRLEANLRGPGPDGCGRASTLVFGRNRGDDPAA